MRRTRQRNLIQAAALASAVLILNVIFRQPWHVTAAVLAIALALGVGLGAGSAITDDLIKRWRKP